MVETFFIVTSWVLLKFMERLCSCVVCTSHSYEVNKIDCVHVHDCWQLRSYCCMQSIAIEQLAS